MIQELSVALPGTLYQIDIKPSFVFPSSQFSMIEVYMNLLYRLLQLSVLTSLIPYRLVKSNMKLFRNNDIGQPCPERVYLLGAPFCWILQ